MGRKRLDLIGVRSGLLRVVSFVGTNEEGATLWGCICECGGSCVARGSDLKRGHKTSCGCLLPNKCADLSGRDYGWLHVVKYHHTQNDQRYWECLCGCGKTTIVSTHDLVNGHTKSCGCYNLVRISERFTTHGLTKDFPRLYGSVYKHGEVIKNDPNYNDMVIDKEFVNGCGELDVPKFTQKLVELYPDKAKEYEENRRLQLDKDYLNKGKVPRVFSPYRCRIVDRVANNAERRNTLRLPDGQSLAEFCTEIGIDTRMDGKVSKQYARIRSAYRKSHAIHHELLAALKADTRRQCRLLYQASMIRQEFEGRLKTLKQKVDALKSSISNP